MKIFSHIKIILIIIFVLLFIKAGYLYPISGFGDYLSPNGDYIRGKTIWDWLELVLIPGVLALTIYFLNRSERQTEKSFREEKLREDSLQSYFDHVTEILRSYTYDELRLQEIPKTILRARTLTVLKMLDGDRKSLLIRFLYQANLINMDKVVIDLSGADLSYVNLSGSDDRGNRDRTFLGYLNLSNVALFGVDLSHANLREAKLYKSVISFADLTNADLSGAHLMDADLRYSTMAGTKLENTNLMLAKLGGATGLTEKQLSEAISLKDAEGIDDLVDSNRISEDTD